MVRVVHPGSGSWFFTHPGSRIQGSKRHRIPDPNLQHWIEGVPTGELGPSLAVVPSPQLLFSLLTLSTSRMDALSRAEEESYIALLGILARYITEKFP